MVRVARLELAASWSQTRRPTNWATPGYEVKEKFAKWSNMWSKKFYHSFTQLSTAVFAEVHGITGEYPTFGAVEPIWCSSSQSRRASCCGTRYLPRCRSNIVSYRPLPLTRLPSSVTGGGRLVPQLRYTWISLYSKGFYTISQGEKPRRSRRYL